MPQSSKVSKASKRTGTSRSEKNLERMGAKLKRCEAHATVETEMTSGEKVEACWKGPR